MNRYFIENSNTVLRKVLNKEENLDIVKDFIESILNFKIKKIILRHYLGEKVKYLPKEEKYGILNVRIIDENDKEFNVGIQIIDGFYSQEKLITYGASIHVNQREYNDNNSVADTYTINILDFRGFSTDNYHKIINFSQRNDLGNMETRDKIRLHVLELPRFNKVVPKTREEQWMQYLKGNDIESIEEIKSNNSAIKKLDKILTDYWKEEEI